MVRVYYMLEEQLREGMKTLTVEPIVIPEPVTPRQEQALEYSAKSSQPAVA
jgi:hypothetical protein